MIYKITTKSNDIKAMFKDRFNIETDEFYMCGASFSSDLVTWSKPDFSFIVLLHSLIDADVDENDLTMEPTTVEDSRPSIHTPFLGEGELMTFNEAIKNLGWILKDKRVYDKDDNPVMMFGVSAQFPVFAFSKEYKEGLLYVVNYLLIQDQNNYSIYNMEVDNNLLPVTEDLFDKYYVLVQSLFSEIVPDSDGDLDA
ncbi:MAG: hypothetical protein WC942_07975 [Clostridia bacterium]|jgi:hypothetical protein